MSETTDKVRALLIEAKQLVYAGLDPGSEVQPQRIEIMKMLEHCLRFNDQIADLED